MRSIALKLAVLAALVFPLQAAIGVWSYPYPSSRRDALDAHRAAGVTAVHFGDSVLRHVAAEDRDRRNLHGMLQAALPDERLGSVEGDGSSMEVYLACVQYLARQDRRPKRLLIPVNLRSFSMEWDPRPEYQARLDRLRLRYGDLAALGFRKPLSIWKIYPMTPLSREEYLRLPVVAQGRRIASVADLVEKDRTAPGMGRLESQFWFRYGYDLAPEHRKLAAMERLVAEARSAGMEPLFYILPLDLAAGERAAGPAFREQATKNLRTILHRVTGAPILDLSAAVGSDDFDWAHTGYPNEHLNERGRRKVARELESFLRRR